jgi:Zn-dependent protease
MENSNFLLNIIIYGLPVVIAITFHEAAHGFIASLCGDDTAKRLGRVSFNPLKHIDLFGTVLFPLLLILLKAPFVFGYAKPVPVDFSRLNNPRRDMVFVAIAGPLTNILLAIASGFLFHFIMFLPESLMGFAAASLKISLYINVTLAIFNMLPLPPLDGGRVAVGILPDFLAKPLADLEKWGMMILIGGLIVIPMLAYQLGYEVNIFSWLLKTPIMKTIDWIASFTHITHL